VPPWRKNRQLEMPPLPEPTFDETVWEDKEQTFDVTNLVSFLVEDP
jgi:hypothetical protein